MKYLWLIPICLMVIPAYAQTTCIIEDFNDETYSMDVRTSTMNDTACNGTDTVWSDSYCTGWTGGSYSCVDGDSDGQKCTHQSQCNVGEPEGECLSDDPAYPQLLPPDYCGACKRWIEGGDEDGSGATELCIRPGYEQFAFGFTEAPHGCTSTTTGDEMWIRFRIKPTTWDWDHTADGTTIKLIEFGAGDGDRVIVFMRHANKYHASECYPPNHATNSYCNLSRLTEASIACTSNSDCDNVCSYGISGCDITYDEIGGDSASDPYQDYGDPPGVDHKCITPAAVWKAGTGGAFVANDNLAYPCIGPVPSTGIVNNTWYNVQMVWKSSSTNTGYIKIWVNNQTEGSPDMCIGYGCGNSSGFNHNATNWDTDDIAFGFHHGKDYPAVNDEICYHVGHFEAVLNDSFDADFGATAAPTGSVVLSGVKIGS